MKATPKHGFRVPDKAEDEDWATLRALAAIRDAVRELPDPDADTVPFRVQPWHEGPEGGQYVTRREVRS